MPYIQFGPHADRRKVSRYSLDVLAELLRRSDNERCVITSTVRSPEEDARVLHDNLVEHGVDAMRRLYLPPGNLVIDVFVADVAKSRLDTVADMAVKIRAIGPYLVSHHCLDEAAQQKLNVLDVGPAQLAHRDAFIDACRREAPPLASNGLLARLLEPPHDPGIHLEIRQPAPNEVPHGT